MHGMNDIIGQTALKDLIGPKIQLAKTIGVALPHLLFCGEKEQGKMTFAAGIAQELGVPLGPLSTENLLTRLDLNGVLTNIKPRQILAIRDIDAIRPDVLGHLVEAISRFRIEILIGSGPGARKLPMDFPRFTFIGTTTKPWMVDEQIRRWCIPCTFAPYSHTEATEIVVRIAQDKGVRLNIDAASDIAAQCKLRPGEAKVFLQRLSNHLPVGDIDCVDRAILRRLNDFLGAGDLYPELLRVADQLRTMDGVEFEHWVGDLFRRAGFEVDITQASGDHGVDLWARMQGRLVAVQCKRWDGAVGEPVVRDLYGAMTAGHAHAGCLVTTGSFTTQAHQFSKDKPLHLMAFDSLMEVVRSPDLLPQLFECR
jgi:hypothetical protein